MTPTVTPQVLSGTLAHLQPLLPTSPQEVSVRGHHLANRLAQADYAREFDATAGLALGSELCTPPHPRHGASPRLPHLLALRLQSDCVLLSWTS